MRNRRLLLAAVLLYVSGSGAAWAQSNDTLMLMNRLNDLDAQVQALNRQMGHGGAGATSSGAPTPLTPGVSGGVSAGAGAADLDVRLSQLQEQVRNLTGEIETQGNQIAQLRAESQRVNQDMQMRLNDLEAKVGGTAASAGGISAAASPGAEPAAVAPMYGPAQTAPQAGTLGTISSSAPTQAVASPEKDYEAAYNMLGQGDYAGAESGFGAFLARYPKHALAPNAQYWLGETYFARGMMDKAASTFADSYKLYPNGAKAPDSLLKLGMSLGQEGKTQEACLTFAELSKQFPAASAKIKTSLSQERTRYKCQ